MHKERLVDFKIPVNTYYSKIGSYLDLISTRMAVIKSKKYQILARTQRKGNALCTVDGNINW